MANIRENKKNGKTVSYRFTVCLEQDAQGKQVRKYTTWTPPEGLTPAKAKRAAERAAEEWEQETRAEYQKEQAAIAQGLAYQLPPEKRKDDFVGFIENRRTLPEVGCHGCHSDAAAHKTLFCFYHTQ